MRIDFPCRRCLEGRCLYDVLMSDPLSPWLGEVKRQHQQVTSSADSGGGMQTPSSREHLLEEVPLQSGQMVADVPARQQVDLHVLREESPLHSASRRSARTWQPSRQALENIIDGAAHLSETLETVFNTVEDEALHSLYYLDADYAFATQQTDVPRSYAQILTLAPVEKQKWLAACRAEPDSHLAIPSIGPRLLTAHDTKAAPIRLSWVFVVKPQETARRGL